MASYLELGMMKKDYKVSNPEYSRIEISFISPDFPVNSVQVMPDYDSIYEASVSKNGKNIIGADNRGPLENPERISFSKCLGRIEANFKQADGSIITRHGTGFVFADNWIMTMGTNIYDTNTGKFADNILYYPALNGNLDNPTFAPIQITTAYAHCRLNPDSSPVILHPYNIAFLEFDSSAERPKGFCGFRYQYSSYNGESILMVGYPEELPEDAADSDKGTYMYRGMGRINNSDINFIYHAADTSPGYEGAPMYMYWGDGNGYVAIGMNAYEAAGSNWGIRLNRPIYGAMKMIREGGMVPVNYIQPAKPDNSGLENISTLFESLRTLGKLYVTRKIYTGAKPTIRSSIIGICNYLRQSKYSDVLWCASLLNPIDKDFTNYIEENYNKLFETIKKYIFEDSDKGVFSEDLRDSSNGVIDLAHMAATLEGYISSSPAADFWYGWGADLATGMADVTSKLNNIESSINNQLLIQTAYETIGSVTSRCNFSDFCCDFDAIKIAQMVSDMEEEENLGKIEATGSEFADILETYYAGPYLNRFKYIFSDLECDCDADLDTIFRKIYSKMNGADETLVLLPTFGNNPSSQVNIDCCQAFANYLLCEV